MSSYVVDIAHIDYLVHAAVTMNEPWHRHSIHFRKQRVNDRNASELGAALLETNIVAVHYQYPNDRTQDTLPGPRPMPVPEEYDYNPYDLPLVTPLRVLKALDSYEYQCCSYPGWRDSDVFRFCDYLRAVCISELPGYDDLPWTIERKAAAPLPAAIY